MKPLITNRRVLTWLCVYPIDESANKWEKIACIIFSLGIFTVHVCTLVAGGMFFHKFVNIDLEPALYSIFHISGAFSVTYIALASFLLRHKITLIFEKLSEIYDTNQNPNILTKKTLLLFLNQDKNADSFRFLARANMNCEWMWKIYIKFGIGGVFINFTLISIVSVLFCYFLHGHFDAKYVHPIFNLILPWDQQTLIGYICEVIVDILHAEAHAFANGSLLLLFVSLCLHHQAFYQMFRYSTRKLEQPDEIRNAQQHICKLIRFHTSVKDLFLESAEVYSSFVLVQLISSMMIMACIFFQFDLQSKHLNFTILSLLIIIAVFVMSTLSLYCYFGKLATESFSQMSDSMYDVNWYELPVKVQKYFILIIGNAQIPLYYHGFKVTVLNLETFCKMTRTVFTYYMLFKTLTAD